MAVLIYVFDVESSDFSPDGGNAYDNSSDRDLQTYGRIIAALAECSPAARIFALVHKMDLVAENYRDAVADSKFCAIAGRSGQFARNLGIYGTSIWDETLYRAWGSIVNSLIPNLGAVKQGLEELKEMTEAEEVVLFEQTTFLTVTRVGNGFGEEGNPYGDRFERLSNIIKTFKGGIG